MAEIDIRAVRISSTTRCWRLFPGSSYRFLNVFLDEDVAFLDMPGFEMPKGKLSESADLAARVRRSEVVLEKLSRDGKGTIPDVSEAELRDFRVGRKRQRNQQAMINFFDEAQFGDVVVMPEPLVENSIRIGTFSDKAGSSLHIKAPRSYGETPVPARRVHWLKRVQENTVSTKLSSILRHPHPFSLIDRSLFFEIYSLAFESYIFNDQYSSVIFNKKDDYLDSDSSFIGLISSLSAFYCQAVEEDRDNLDEILNAIINPADIQYLCSYAADIHSPGFTRYTSSTRTALVISAIVASLLLLSSCDSKESMSEELNKLEYVNRAAPPDDPCTPVVSTASNRLLQSLGADTVWQMCKTMRAAHERAGIESSARVHR